MGDVLLWAKDLRWAAMVLALCGLVLVARGTYWMLAFTVLWLTGDVVMDRANVDGWLAMAISCVVAGSLLALVAKTGVRDRGTPVGRGVALTCSAVAASLASVLFFVEPSAQHDLPNGMLAFAVFLSVSLLSTAVAVALAARSAASPHAVLAGVGLAVLVGLPMIACLVWLMLNEVEPGVFGGAVLLVPMLGVPLIVVGCRLLVRGVPAAVGWLGYAGLTVIASGAFVVVLLAGLAVTYTVQPMVFAVLGDKRSLGVDGYLTPLAALGAGLVLAAIVNVQRFGRRQTV